MLKIELDVNGDNKLRERGLKALDSCLHYTMTHSGYDGRHIKLFDVDHFYNRHMTMPQFHFVEKCIDGEKFVMIPKSVGYAGCRVGFVVNKALHRQDMLLKGHPTEPVLMFIEEQLPRGLNYERVAEIFKDKKNLALLDALGMPLLEQERKAYALFG